MGQVGHVMHTMRERFGILAMLLTVASTAACGLTPTALDASSMGFANDGYLAHGRPIPDREQGFMRARLVDDARWSTSALAGLLTRAAKQVVERYPGTSPLVIGDVSTRGGGKHGRHGSHRTGRDVDLLFYLLNERGVSTQASGFFVFDQRGVSRVAEQALMRDRDRGLRFFDTARNWELVRALVTDQEPVQWIFCAAGIKQRLLDYARAHERDASVFIRASYVLHQPSRGNPHADHFHVRVACTARERALGCLDAGPIWPWFRNEHEKPEWSEGRNDDATLVQALVADAAP
jgi:penicillin-insensitive murein endopeptidase